MMHLWFLKDADVSLSLGRKKRQLQQSPFYSRTEKSEPGDLALTFKTHLCSTKTEDPHLLKMGLDYTPSHFCFYNSCTSAGPIFILPFK